MYYIIKTQYLENYGVFDEPAQPRWKAKGGDTYLLYIPAGIDEHRLLCNFKAEECVKHSPAGRTYPVGDQIKIPTAIPKRRMFSEGSQGIYEWCAYEINEPWFKFVTVTSVNTWEIQSIDVDPDLFYEEEESGALYKLANKIKELTERADGIPSGR